MKFKLDSVAQWLVIIGAVNWGLVAFNWNLVNALLGAWPVAEKAVYALVGLSALWMIWAMFKKK